MRFHRLLSAVLIPIFLLIGMPQPAFAYFLRTYTYDGNGNPASIASSNANGTSVTYAYDALNRLGTVADAHLGSASYNYDVGGTSADSRP